MAFFEVKNINKEYANHQALKDISIQVEKGSIFGLLGPNGAGKTTLIRIINQITAPDTGDILFNGEKLKPSDIKRIGYLPEERGLYKKMKVGEQAIYLAQLKGMSSKEAKIKLQKWFEKFKITDWWDKKVEELSKGMQQKIQFIVTVLHEPDLLIFDEPFSGFDPINTKLLKREILELRDKGATIIFSTHNMSSVEEICDHIALINKSEKILSGSVEEIKNNFRTYKYIIEHTTKSFNLEAINNPIFELIDTKELKNHKSMTLELKQGYSSKELLTQLLPYLDIISYKEIVPSMDEIFIDAVEGNKNILLNRD